MTSSSVEGAPFVSVVIPIRNEASFIADLIGAVLAQDYPHERVEVIVADGMSTDGTREILAKLQSDNPRLILVDNPDRIVPTALNRALAMSRGQIVVRIDGHALIASDFVRQSVTTLAEHPEAWSVGGPIRHTANTTFGHAVALAMAHPLGVGNAMHHYADYDGYADGAAFPAIRRDVFERIGTFDERLVRNQDDDFNYRISRAGGKIYVSSRIRYSYFVRERIDQLFRQYFQYGFWRIPVMEKHRRPTTLRQVAPITFYCMCVVLLIAGLWWHEPAIAVALPMGYLTALIFAGVASVSRSSMRIAVCVPVAIATMHAGYAAGVAYGMWARLFRPGAWNIQGKMAGISR